MATYTDYFERDLAITDSATVIDLGQIYYDYVMDEGGRVFLLGDFESDAGSAIKAVWVSKALDFSDADSKLGDVFKTVDRVRLEYRDVSANTPVTIYISTDNGVTWVSESRTLGTGDGKVKTADFYFLDNESITGLYFMFKIESESASTRFEWNSLKAFVKPRGEWFEVS